MKKYLITLASGCLLLTQSVPALAQGAYETTSEMLAYCDGSSELGIDGEVFCTGYISGLLDTHRLMQDLTGMPFYCLPQAGITVNEALVIIESYARRNPGEYDQGFMSTAFLAFADKYPCQ